MASGTKTKKILLVSTDRVFAQDTRTAFAASEVIELLTLEKSVNELRGEVLEADFGTVIVDMDAAKLEEIESLQRVMRRLEGSVPVVVVTQEFNAAAVCILRVLDGGGWGQIEEGSSTGKPSWPDGVRPG